MIPVCLFIKKIALYRYSNRLRHFTARLAIIGKILFIAMLTCNAMASGAADVNLPFSHFIDCEVCSEMIALPPGHYMMGATEEEFKGIDQYRVMYLDETPRHEVKIKPFALAKFDITRKQFSIFANETRFNGKGCHTFNGKNWITDANFDWHNPGFNQTENDPVVCVSWDDAQKFIDWLNAKLPKAVIRKYRLPTEEEWEYAARAGTVTATYWGGNPLDQCRHENTRDYSAASVLGTSLPIADCTDGYVETSPVGSFRPNPWGLFDMLGNVIQWTADCPNWGYSMRPPLHPGFETCQGRAVRGASWATVPVGVRSAFRSEAPKNTRDGIFGFRIATDLPQ